MAVLYGITEANAVGADITTAHVANTFIPISVALFARAAGHGVPYFDAGLGHLDLDISGATFANEVARECDGFINPPPNDLRATGVVSGGTLKPPMYFECKNVLHRGVSTEIVLRQDCYFNCLQNVLCNNTERYATLEALVGDNAIVATPYLWCSVWDCNTDRVGLFVVSDVALLRMIINANTARSRAVVPLMDEALLDYAALGRMEYKPSKASSVAHRKISLYPFKGVVIPMRYALGEIVLGDIAPVQNIWHHVVRIHHVAKVQALEARVAELEAKISAAGEAAVRVAMRAVLADIDALRLGRGAPR